MNDINGQLALVAGNLFSRVEDLRTLLEQLQNSGHCQGEFCMIHRAANGTETKLVIHIDGLMFTMMPIDQASALRIDAYSCPDLE